MDLGHSHVISIYSFYLLSYQSYRYDHILCNDTPLCVRLTVRALCLHPYMPQALAQSVWLVDTCQWGEWMNEWMDPNSGTKLLFDLYSLTIKLEVGPDGQTWRLFLSPIDHAPPSLSGVRTWITANMFGKLTTHIHLILALQAQQMWTVWKNIPGEWRSLPACQSSLWCGESRLS